MMRVSHKRSYDSLLTDSPGFGWSPHAGVNVEVFEADYMNHSPSSKRFRPCEESMGNQCKRSTQSSLTPIKLRTQPKNTLLTKLTDAEIIKLLEFLPKSRRRHHTTNGSFYSAKSEPLFSLEDIIYIIEGTKQEKTEELLKEHNRILEERLSEQAREYENATEELINRKFEARNFDYLS